MAHTSSCSASVNDRCACSCGGWLHGGFGGGQRPVHMVVRVLPPPQESGDTDNPFVVWTASDLLDLISRDKGALVDDVAAETGHAAQAVLDHLAGESQRKPRFRGHWLCRLLEEVVELLDRLSLTGIAEDVVRDVCRHAAVGAIASSVVVAVTRRLVQFVATPLDAATGRLQALYLLRLAALAVCPDPPRHKSLDRTCANPLAADFVGEATKNELRSA